MRGLLLLLILATVLALTSLTDLAVARPQQDASATTFGPTSILKKSNGTSKSSSKKARAARRKRRQRNVSVALEPIGTVTRGTTVAIQATLSDPNAVCDLKLTYADGSTDQPSTVVAHNQRICAFQVTIPSRAGVVGSATAVLIAKVGHERTRTSDQQTLTVK